MPPLPPSNVEIDTKRGWGVKGEEGRERVHAPRAQSEDVRLWEVQRGQILQKGLGKPRLIQIQKQYTTPEVSICVLAETPGGRPDHPPALW